MNPNLHIDLMEVEYSAILDRIASNKSSISTRLNLSNEVENSILLSWISNL